MVVHHEIVFAFGRAERSSIGTFQHSIAKSKPIEPLLGQVSNPPFPIPTSASAIGLPRFLFAPVDAPQKTGEQPDNTDRQQDHGGDLLPAVECVADG